MKKTLHIGDNTSWKGSMKFSMHGLAPKYGYVIMDFDYLECLLLEMIEDGTLKLVRIKRDSIWRPYPIGGFYNRTYMYKGEDLGKSYGLSVIKHQ